MARRLHPLLMERWPQLSTATAAVRVLGGARSPVSEEEEEAEVVASVAVELRYCALHLPSRSPMLQLLWACLRSQPSTLLGVGLQASLGRGEAVSREREEFRLCLVEELTVFELLLFLCVICLFSKKVAFPSMYSLVFSNSSCYLPATASVSASVPASASATAAASDTLNVEVTVSSAVALEKV
jgi:hypothetical protein